MLNKVYIAIIGVLLIGFSRMGGAVESQSVFLDTQDQKTIQGDFYNAHLERGVVFVHGARFNKQGWRELANKLYDEGFSSIAINLRTQGMKKIPFWVRRKAKSYLDIEASVSYLRRRGCSKIILIGSDVAAGDIVRVVNNDTYRSITKIVLFMPVGAGKLKNPSVEKLILYSTGRKSAKRQKVYYDSLSMPKKKITYPCTAYAQGLLRSKYKVLVMNDIVKFLNK